MPLCQGVRSLQLIKDDKRFTPMFIMTNSKTCVLHEYQLKTAFHSTSYNSENIHIQACNHSGIKKKICPCHVGEEQLQL